QYLNVNTLLFLNSKNCYHFILCFFAKVCKFCIFYKSSSKFYNTVSTFRKLVNI
uniref:Uncharacterized protein n=1 Tax=Ciona intestinalis TaxID=7719 RepID=H2XK63_CIOIN